MGSIGPQKSGNLGSCGFNQLRRPLRRPDQIGTPQDDSFNRLFTSLLCLNRYYTTAGSFWPLIMLIPISQISIPARITLAAVLLTGQHTPRSEGSKAGGRL